MLCKNYRMLPILALMAAMWIPQLVNAQGTEKVSPLLDVQGKGGKKAVGLTPAQIKRAYGFDKINNDGKDQTIAIIDAFDHPAIERDLAMFNNQFNLPACTTQNGCFRKVMDCGTPGCIINPAVDDPRYQVWALEIALDVEWAHAIAPRANILLVEVSNDTLDVLLGGVDIAVNPPNSANVVSMSWGGPEFDGEQGAQDAHFHNPHNPNVTFFAGAGDFGHAFGTLYPAASPYVMAVGGTRLNIDQDGNYLSEKAWSGVDGGISPFESEPDYQLDYQIPNDPQHKKGIPDVAFDGAPATGVAVYDSQPYFGSTGWIQVGGTSIGPPQWSGLIAIANALRAKNNQPALIGSHGVLYTAAQDRDGDAAYHDVTNGKDGNCGTLCKAKPGYDFVTGLGTPKADLLIPALRDLVDR
ncbi:MAG TPA: S53 family peptidase [Terriglobia bacterium]|nr:S53 family peptidase [Terriglobia bacterium]